MKNRHSSPPQMHNAPCFHRNFKNRCAFSLTELLAVIFVIGLLVALLLPALEGARETALATKCALNMRQLGVTIQACAAETQGGYLPWYDMSYGAQKGSYIYGMWWWPVYSYSGSDALGSSMICPSDNNPLQLLLTAPTAAQELKDSYLYNQGFGYNNGTTWVYAKRSLTRARYPSRVPVLGDSITNSYDLSLGFESLDSVWGRHNHGTTGNLLLLDGHVEVIKNPEVISPTYQQLEANYDWVVTQ